LGETKDLVLVAKWLANVDRILPLP